MKKLFKKCDKILLFMMIIYSIIGFVMVFSSSSIVSVLKEHNSPYAYFIKQAIFVGVSYFFGFLLILRIPINNYKKLIWPAVIILIMSLIGLILKGELINGSKSWYDLGFFNLQPSEFAKTIFIMYMAQYFYKFQKDNKEKTISRALVPIFVCILITVPILMQPDLGTAVVLVGIAGIGIFFVPFNKTNRKKLFLIYGVLILVIGSAFYFGKDYLLRDRQIKRLTYKEACKRYTEETGYQVCNSLIAINNGGLKGAGFGNSTQKYMYLPAGHTDFAFSIVIEELGVIVSTFILIGYIIILYRIYKIAKSAYNICSSLIAFSALIYICIHIFINLYGIMGLIPLTGIPLPFISYGGSFNVNLIIILFLVLRVSIENSDAKIKHEIAKI